MYCPITCIQVNAAVCVLAAIAQASMSAVNALNIVKVGLVCYVIEYAP